MLVHEKAYGDFVGQLVERAKKMVVGDLLLLEAERLGDRRAGHVGRLGAFPNFDLTAVGAPPRDRH